jgi:hypothetical protein
MRFEQSVSAGADELAAASLLGLSATALLLPDGLLGQTHIATTGLGSMY